MPSEALPAVNVEFPFGLESDTACVSVLPSQDTEPHCTVPTHPPREAVTGLTGPFHTDVHLISCLVWPMKSGCGVWMTVERDEKFQDN